MATKRAAGYVRVSDESQVETHSLDGQVREIERHCRQQGLDLVELYRDEGVSAHTAQVEKRPAFARMLADAGDDRFDVVVVHTLDRFARNVGVQRQAMQRLGEAGVGLVSLTEHFDFSTPAGRLMLTTIGAYSEFFSDLLGVHVAKGQAERARAGLPVGPVPFGYSAPEPGAMPVAVPEEAEAVQEVFARRAAGASNGEIASWLNGLGLRTRNGRIFTAHAVKDMLANRFYAGVVRYRGEEFDGQHEAVVEEALWERVRRRKGPSRRRARPRAEAALRGLVRCARCGHPLHCETNHAGHVMYRERHACDCPTNGKAVSARRIDAAVGEHFAAFRLPGDWREQIVALATATEGEDVAALQAQRRRLARAYADGAFDEPEYEARLAEVDGRLAAAEPVAGPDLEAVGVLLDDLPALWTAATPAERRELLGPLVERVTVDVGEKGLVEVIPSSTASALVRAA